MKITDTMKQKVEQLNNENDLNCMPLEIMVSKFKNEKYDFPIYHTFDRKGKKLQVKFRKCCSNVPKNSCICFIDKDDMNIDNDGRYRTLWVKEILEIMSFEKDTSKLDELIQMDE